MNIQPNLQTVAPRGPLAALLAAPAGAPDLPPSWGSDRFAPTSFDRWFKQYAYDRPSGPSPRPTSLLGKVVAAAVSAFAWILGKVPFLAGAANWIYTKIKPRHGILPATGPLRNVGELTPALYRGAQPSLQGFQDLKARGFDTVINLRAEEPQERAVVEGLGMKYVYLPMNGLMAPTDAQTIAFLRAATDPANGKIYFHCKHGSDRTGTMAAAYRIAAQGWTPAEAMAEMPRYGFHVLTQQNKIRYLEGFPKRWAKLPAIDRAHILHLSTRVKLHA